MDFDLEEALRQFPLPEAVPDETFTLTDMAKALDVTEPTLKRYISAGMPVVSHGSNGRGYELRFSECYAWKSWRDGEEAARKKARSEAIGQMRLLFRNDEDAEAEATTLTAKEIKEESDAEIARLKAAQLRGELVPVERVRDAIERAVVGFRNGMITLPDFAEIELGLSPEDVDKLQGWVDGVLHELEIRINAAVDPEGEVRAFKARNAE